MEDKERYWSVEEIKLLKKFYSSNICPDDLLKKFPKRNWNSLLHKACRLGLKKGKYIPKDRKSRKWTQSEIDFVRTYYGNKPDEWIQEQLPHRSICSIKRIAVRYRPKKLRKRVFSRNPSWSEFEDTLLLQNYQQMTTDELLEVIPNRTYDAIRARIMVLGLDRSSEHLYRAAKNFRWTDEEKALLIENKDKSINVLQELFPERTAYSIRNMLKRYRKTLQVSV